MSERLYVMQVLAEKMRKSFERGDLVDAQNIEAFLRSLEGMDDEQYSDLSDEGSSDCLAA